MPWSLADLLPPLLPHLAPALAAPSAIPPLQELAGRLAPIPRGGFECRLGDNPQVDLQQCVAVASDHAQALSRHVEKLVGAYGVDRRGWAALYQFILRWNDPTACLYHAIPELWLECDADATGGEAALPSLFFGLRPSAAACVDNCSVAESALTLLSGQAAWSAVAPNLRRCFDACPTDVFVSHIGLMLSRATDALRVNIKRLQPETLAGYLADVGWPGPIDEIADLMAVLAPQVDRVTVCLDIGRSVWPQVGLECVLQRQPPQEVRWYPFLTDLVERGWCTPAKRDALLAWPGQIDPTTATHPWPTPLLVASLVQPPDQFSVFERRLSHIKVVYRPQQIPEAKGYLWFSHEWLQPLSKEVAHDH
jgi:hypothetical protein